MQRFTGLAWRAGAAALAALLLAGCDTHSPPPISNGDLQRARQFKRFTVYWVGRRFDGIPLTAADSEADYDPTIGWRVYYGDCKKHSAVLDNSGCVLPLEITTVVYKPHSNDGLGPRHNTIVRGVPAVVYNHGNSIELYTNRLSIDVKADTALHARRAAQAVVPLNRKAPPPRLLAPPKFRPGVAHDPHADAIANRLRSPKRQFPRAHRS